MPALRRREFITLLYNFLRDIVPRLCQGKPGKINVESPGAGTSSHLAGELFKLHNSDAPH
jgi:hypothetical protein